MLKKLLVGAVVSLGLMGAANADVLTVGGGWSGFSFGDVGSSLFPEFTFTLTSTATLKVTDAFLDGDQFNLVLNGVNKGNTSNPVNDGTQLGSDYDAAFASAKFSHSAFVLGPGAYTLDGTVVLSPYGGGGGAAELVAGGVPEPTTWAMLLIGFAGLGLVGRRAARKAQAA